MAEMVEKIWQRIVELSKNEKLIFMICLLVLLYIPLRISAYNYTPRDDIRRHVAKVVSGRDWPDILVMRDEFQTQDHNAGWHTILGFFHSLGLEKESLLLLSLFGLFWSLAIAGLFIHRHRPLAWVASLFCMLLVSSPQRWMLGRPYILSSAVLLILLALWKAEQADSDRKRIFITAGLIAVAGWVHGAWYLFVLLPICLVMAGRIKCALAASLGWLGGSLIAGMLTGHPFQYLVLQVSQTLASTGSAPVQRLLVGEFLSQINITAIIVLAFIVGIASLAKLPATIILRNPAFWLTLTGWILGTINGRFWMDWGTIAMLCLTAQVFAELWQKYQHRLGVYRPASIALIIIGFFFAFTADSGSRWSNSEFDDPLRIEDPAHEGWLPDAGGILYSDSMTLYYDTFLANPDGPWRYILGHEPALMPEDDLQTLRQIQLYNYTLDHLYNDWIKKMTLADRLILKRPPKQQPEIPELEWKYVAYFTWSGRLPRIPETTIEANP